MRTTPQFPPKGRARWIPVDGLEGASADNEGVALVVLQLHRVRSLLVALAQHLHQSFDFIHFFSTSFHLRVLFAFLCFQGSGFRVEV